MLRSWSVVVNSYSSKLKTACRRGRQHEVGVRLPKLYVTTSQAVTSLLQAQWTAIPSAHVAQEPRPHTLSGPGTNEKVHVKKMSADAKSFFSSGF